MMHLPAADPVQRAAGQGTGSHTVSGANAYRCDGVSVVIKIIAVLCSLSSPEIARSRLSPPRLR